MRPLALLLALTACVAAATAGPLRSAGEGAAAAPVPPTATPTPVPGLLVLGPGGTESALVGVIASARGRVLVEAFALTDGAVIAALQAAERRGVDVRVMLDPRGLNTATTLAQLNRAGIRTRPPNNTYAVTHLDQVVVDASTLAVSTAALTPLGLGQGGRGYLVIDRDRRDVVQGASIFYDDWLRRTVTLFGDNLLVLPDAANRIAGLIDGAGIRLELYSSGLSDPGIVSSLRAARDRGVVVRILTPRGSTMGTLPSLAQRSQVRLRDEGAGTLLVVDRHTVLVGSMDLSSNTLSNSRELGVILSGGPVVSLVDGFFFSEFARATVLLPAAPPLTARGRTVVVGALKVAVSVSPVVRLGGQALLVIATAPGARISVSVAYPPGSKPAATATGTSGSADAHGAFVYRWFVTGRIKTGLTNVHILVRGRSSAIRYTARLAIIR